MGFASRYNTTTKRFAIDTTGFEYKGLDHFPLDTVITVRGMFINPKTTFGDAAVLITDTCLVNLPAHMVSTIKSMLEDPEVVDVCDNGLLGFKTYTYQATKFNRTCFGVDFVDIT